VLVDRLRLKEGVEEGEGVYCRFKPEVLPEYEKIFFREGEYYGEVFERVSRRCQEKGIRCEINRL
jgi:hypothetical protein